MTELPHAKQLCPKENSMAADVALFTCEVAKYNEPCKWSPWLSANTSAAKMPQIFSMKPCSPIVESLCFHEQLGLLVGKLEMLHHLDDSQQRRLRRNENSWFFVYEAVPVKLSSFAWLNSCPMWKVSAQISGQMCIKWHHISTKQLPTQPAYTNLMSWIMIW